MDESRRKQEWFHPDVPKNPILPEEEHRMSDCRSTLSDSPAFTVDDPRFNKVFKAILGLCLYLSLLSPPQLMR